MKNDIIIDSWASLNSNVFNSHFRALPILMYFSHSGIQHAKTVNAPEPSLDFEPRIALMKKHLPEIINYLEEGFLMVR